MIYQRLSPDFEINQTGFLRKEPHRGSERVRVEGVFSPRPETGGLRQLFFKSWLDAQKPLVTTRYQADQLTAYPATIFSPDFLKESRGYGAGFAMQLDYHSGTRIELFASRQHRYDITGPYDSDSLGVRLGTPRQRKIALAASAFVDDFYNFDRRHVSREWALNLDLTILPVDQWRIETRLRHSSAFDPGDNLEDRIWLGAFRTEILFSPDMFLRLFFQARSTRTPSGTQKSYLISNVFGWEFRRGSRFFIAFNESRDDAAGSLRLVNQAIIFKIAHQIDM